MIANHKILRSRAVFVLGEEEVARLEKLSILEIQEITTSHYIGFNKMQFEACGDLIASITMSQNQPDDATQTRQE